MLTRHVTLGKWMNFTWMDYVALVSDLNQRGRPPQPRCQSPVVAVQSLSCVWLFKPHESQHARPPYTSPTTRIHSNSSPSSQWCHPTISPSVIPFSSCPQSLPTSESFPMSQLFAWGGQSTGVSALVSGLVRRFSGRRNCPQAGYIIVI